MTYSWPSKGKFAATWLPKWNATTQQITYPTAIYAYAVGTTNRLTLYTDETGATTLSNNPVPTGVATNNPGLDVNGNLILFGDVGKFDLVVDGSRFTYAFSPSPDDLATAIDQLNTAIITATTAN